MTCPCIHMREAAAKVCDIHADERAWIPNEAVTDEHRYRDYEAERALRNAARAIRSLPLCGRCESHVMVPVEPTEEMMRHGTGAFLSLGTKTARAIYKAMLAARPK